MFKPERGFEMRDLRLIMESAEPVKKPCVSCVYYRGTPYLDNTWYPECHHQSNCKGYSTLDASVIPHYRIHDMRALSSNCGVFGRFHTLKSEYQAQQQAMQQAMQKPKKDLTDEL